MSISLRLSLVYAAVLSHVLVRERKCVCDAFCDAPEGDFDGYARILLQGFFFSNAETRTVRVCGV